LNKKFLYKDRNQRTLWPCRPSWCCGCWPPCRRRCGAA